jgi:hypothetical protein
VNLLYLAKLVLFLIIYNEVSKNCSHFNIAVGKSINKGVYNPRFHKG